MDELNVNVEISGKEMNRALAEKLILVTHYMDCGHYLVTISFELRLTASCLMLMI